MSNNKPTAVYIAGPYSGGEWGTNVRKAIEAAERLFAAGYTPIIPHTMTSLWSLHYKREGHEWLELDYELIELCDILVRLPGESPGADKEVEHAKENGIRVVHGVEPLVKNP
jgi:hypothetical protein